MLFNMMNNNSTAGVIPAQRARRKVLFAVRDLLREMKGDSPTYREVGERVGMKPNTVGKRVEELMAAGWLTRTREHRTLKLARPLRRRTPKF